MLKTYFGRVISLLFLLFTTALFAQIKSDVNITIVNSKLTKQFLHKQNDSFNPVYDWEILLLNNKIRYNVIEDEGLDDFDFRNTDVLILPSVEVLSEDAAENLSKYLKLGGGIFVLGNLGEFDEFGNTLNRNLVNNILGFKIKKIFDPHSPGWNFKISRSNILSRSTFFRNNFLILNQHPTYFCEIPSYGGNTLGSFILDKNSVLGEINLPGIVSVEKEGGRIIWFGFQLSQISSFENEANPINELVINSINWLIKKPEVWVNRFPDNYNSLSILTFQVENTKKFTEEILPLLKAREITSVFLVKPTEIIKSYENLNALSAVGEVIVYQDKFEIINKDNSFIEDFLNKSISVIRKNTIQKTVGIFINNLVDPSEYNSLLKESSFDFFIDQNFRIYLNDVESNTFESLNSFNYEKTDLVPVFQKELKELFDEDFYIKLETSDIINMFLPSKNYHGTDFSASDIINECVSRVSQESVWITNYSVLIDWFNKTKNLIAEIEQSTDDNLLTINLSNSGNSSAEQVGLLLPITSSYKNLEMISNDLSLRYDNKTGLYNVLIPYIKPNQTLLIDLNYKQ